MSFGTRSRRASGYSIPPPRESPSFAMKSSTLRAKLYDLGITPSRGRPRVSNDNPYSESLFRTLKYCLL
ncbi:Integrase catalytic region [mine drainage metagenome]|uniref:Integrase catalytic region n=1 Tax=mine drainage metagenome TaxID=410659 RepID=T0ZTN4_9ZZZZ